MCLHLSLNALHMEIIERFGRMFNEEMDWFYFPTYHKSGLNITDELMIIPMDQPTKLDFARWGNILNWGDVEDLPNAVYFDKVFNVESERALYNHKYADLLRYKRCLILADGYFSPDFPDAQNPPKFFYQKNDEAFERRSVFAFAGIFEKSLNLYSCAILTTGLEHPIHNGQEKNKRVPIVLDKGFEDEWLRKDLTDEGITNLMTFGRTKDYFSSHLVSTDIYKEDLVTNKPYIIEPI